MFGTLSVTKGKKVFVRTQRKGEWKRGGMGGRDESEPNEADKAQRPGL